MSRSDNQKPVLQESIWPVGDKYPRPASMVVRQRSKVDSTGPTHGSIRVRICGFMSSTAPIGFPAGHDYILHVGWLHSITRLLSRNLGGRDTASRQPWAVDSFLGPRDGGRAVARCAAE